MENKNNDDLLGAERSIDLARDDKQLLEGRREAVTKLAYASPVLVSLLFSKSAAAISPPPPPPGG